MVEVLTEIKTAEAKAEEQKRDARRAAAQCREDATAKGKQHLESEIQKAVATASATEQQARQVADAYLAQTDEQWKQESESLLDSARGKMDAAANLIVERIVGSL